MHSFRLFALSLLLLLLPGCRSLQIEQPTPISASDWLTEGDSPLRRNRSAEAPEPPLETAWIYNAAAGFGPGSPLLLKGAVLVSTRKGEIHAISLETGKRLGMKGFGDSIEGTPVIDKGLIYIPIAWGGKVLYAYDLRRADVVWTARGAPIEAGLLLLEETILSVDVESTVKSYDLKTGDVRWEDRLDTLATVQASPVAAGPGRFVVADDRGRVVAFDTEHGNRIWTRHLSAPVYSSPASDEETVFLPTTRGRFFALDAVTGDTQWTYTTPDTTVHFTAPATDGEDVVFGGSDGVLRLLDRKTGRVRWTFQVDEAFTAAPLLTPETVYAGSMGRRIYGVDRRDGSLRWEQELKGRVKSAMAARNDRLVVLTEPRYVYLFQPAASDYAAHE